MISAASTSTTRRGASIPSYSARTAASASGSASGKRPTTTRLGWPKSSTAVPWRRNSGFVNTRAVGSPAASIVGRVPPTGSVLRMTRMSSGPIRSRSAVMAASSWRRSLVPSSPIGVPTQTRMIPGSSGIAGPTVSRPSPTAVSKASWSPSSWIGIRPARRDLEPGRTGLDELDDVAEPGQPDGRHQPDVAGADDRDGTLWASRHRERGYQRDRPPAIGVPPGHGPAWRLTGVLPSGTCHAFVLNGGAERADDHRSFPLPTAAGRTSADRRRPRRRHVRQTSLFGSSTVGPTSTPSPGPPAGPSSTSAVTTATGLPFLRGSPGRRSGSTCHRQPSRPRAPDPKRQPSTFV